MSYSKLPPQGLSFVYCTTICSPNNCNVCLSGRLVSNTYEQYAADWRKNLSLFDEIKVKLDGVWYLFSRKLYLSTVWCDFCGNKKYSDNRLTFVSMFVTTARALLRILVYFILANRFFLKFSKICKKNDFELFFMRICL